MRDTLSNMVSCFLMSRQKAHMTTSNSQFFAYLHMLKVFNCFIRYFMNSCCTTLQTHVRIGIDLLSFYRQQKCQFSCRYLVSRRLFHLRNTENRLIQTVAFFPRLANIHHQRSEISQYNIIKPVIENWGKMTRHYRKLYFVSYLGHYK